MERTSRTSEPRTERIKTFNGFHSTASHTFSFRHQKSARLQLTGQQQYNRHRRGDPNIARHTTRIALWWTAIHERDVACRDTLQPSPFARSLPQNPTVSRQDKWQAAVTGEKKNSRAHKRVRVEPDKRASRLILGGLGEKVVPITLRGAAVSRPECSANTNARTPFGAAHLPLPSPIGRLRYPPLARTGATGAATLRGTAALCLLAIDVGSTLQCCTVPPTMAFNRKSTKPECGTTGRLNE